MSWSRKAPREVPENPGTSSGHFLPSPCCPYQPALHRAPATGYVCPPGPQDEQRLHCGWKPSREENEDPVGKLWSGPGPREQRLMESRASGSEGDTCQGFLRVDGLLASGQSQGGGRGIAFRWPLAAGRLQEPGKERQGLWTNLLLPQPGTTL